MVMDPSFSEFSDSINGFKFDNEAVLPSFDQSPNPSNLFNFKDGSVDLNYLDLPFPPPDRDPFSSTPLSGVSLELDSPDDHDTSVVLKYLNQILMEENMEEKPSMFHDPLALQAAEKSFYEVLGEKLPPSPYQPPVFIDQNAESPDDNFFGSSSKNSTNSSTSAANSIDPPWADNSLEFKSSVRHTHPLEYFSQSTLQSSSQWSFSSINSFSNNGPVHSSGGTHLAPNIFSDSDSILQFKRGMEEASKFLPSGNPLVIDLDKYALRPESNGGASEVVIRVEKDEMDNSPNDSRGRKHYHQGSGDFEDERSSKQSAVYMEEAELSEMFDRVLLCTEENACCNEELPSEVDKTLHRNGQKNGSKGGKTRSKKQENKSEVVDVRNLLISCAQSIAADDCRSAREQLKQIRQHSSPSGDASQRLAHIFANGLEARLAGTGTQIYAALASTGISAAEKLKAYQVYLSACPFLKISMFFANMMIWEAASEARSLHIVDFGIQYGFQWPILIQHLSKRPGGPPKLRITGIELPQPGFRPTERLEETGRRLANYCERFNVPFEYHPIATQKWETIKIEDLKIESDGVLAVNCLFRFQNLLDETVVANSPRDAVLKLIRKMNPNIFVHAVFNGSYNAPIFLTRFKEALFHYSALFDIFDTTIPRENQQRLNFEIEFCGREAMNAIACEGPERVVRPETYKQWQIGNTRAGFRLLPLNQEVVKKFRDKVKAGYHKDFVFDEDGYWMLQGWKGRTICGSSCWVPA